MELFSGKNLRSIVCALFDFEVPYGGFEEHLPGTTHEVSRCEWLGVDIYSLVVAYPRNGLWHWYNSGCEFPRNECWACSWLLI